MKCSVAVVLQSINVPHIIMFFVAQKGFQNAFVYSTDYAVSLRQKLLCTSSVVTVANDGIA